MNSYKHFTKRITAGLLTLILAFSACADVVPVYASQDPGAGEPVYEEVMQDLSVSANDAARDQDTGEKDQADAAEGTLTADETGAADPVTDDIADEDTDVAVGRDGIAHDGIFYISAESADCLDEEETEVYLDMCDDAANIKAQFPDSGDIVISLDGQGQLAMNYSIPVNELNLSADDAYTADDLTKPAAITEEDTVYDLETVPDSEEAVSDDGEYLPETGDKEEEGDYIPSNLERAGAGEIEIEYIEGEDVADIDSLFGDDDVNFFRNQLGSTGKKIYDAGKKALVKNKKTGFTVSGYPASYDICNGLSALITTYSSSFGWMSKSENSGWSARVTWSRYAGYKASISIKKSKHYNAKLNKSANELVKRLVGEAYEYAGQYYPGNPTYGIVTYFNDWICDNNYYNYDGVAERGADTASATYYFCHSPYGCLLKGYGVCESYAMAMSMLLDAAGVRNIYVVGYAGEGHAWNHVRMQNGKYYLLDSTWNDSGSDCLLTPNDGRHESRGRIFKSGKNFNFPTLENTRYATTTENIYLSRSELILQNGKSQAIGVDDYHRDFVKKWSSDNPAVAKVDGAGKVKAVAPGRAVITCNIAGKELYCNVYVYQFTGLKFANNKSSMSVVYGNPDSLFDSSDTTTYEIDIAQKNPTLTAQYIYSKQSMAAPRLSYSKKGIATAAVSFADNKILLKVTPVKLGTTTVTVKWAGKTAKLKYSAKVKIQEDMFDLSAIDTLAAGHPIYTGKAFKPAVKKSATAPGGLKYKVKYSGNVNAGMASVTVTGQGSYGDSITRTFQIYPVDISGPDVKASVAGTSVYKAVANPAATIVKLGRKTLKRGKDYEVKYDGSTEVPVNAGHYYVSIIGKGNYSGYVGGGTFQYVIDPAGPKNIKVSCPKAVKYKKGGASCPRVSVKLGKKPLIADTDYSLNYYRLDAEGIRTRIDPALKLEKGTYIAEITYRGYNLTEEVKKAPVTRQFKVK